MSFSETTALVVSGGGFQGQTLVDALREGGIATVICDCYADAPTRYLADYFEQVPSLTDPKFGPALRDVAVRHRICAVFPATSHELRVLARLRDDLAKDGVLVASSPEAVVDILSDKLSTYTLLAKAQISVQAVIDPERELGFPMLGKPRDGWGGRGQEVIKTPTEWRLRQPCIDTAQYVWVPFLEHFDEYSVDFGIGPNGKLGRLIVRKRVSTSGGFAVISESIENAALRKLGESVAQTLASIGAIGLFNVQCIYAPEGVWVTDINPRMGTSASHALAEGLNMPAEWLAMAGVEIKKRTFPGERRLVRTVRHLRDVVIPIISTPKAMVFDLDDTLIDHKRWYFDRLVRLWDVPAVELASKLDKGAWSRLVASVIDDGARTLLVDQLAERVGVDRMALLDAYRNATQGVSTLRPGVAQALQALSSAGIRLAVLTDNRVATQRAKLDSLPNAVKALFDTVVFSQELGHEKPHPAAFDAVTLQLKVAAKDCIMVGDDLYRDALGALEAGFAHALLVDSGAGFIRNHRASFEQVPAHFDQRIHCMDVADIRFLFPEKAVR